MTTRFIAPSSTLKDFNVGCRLGLMATMHCAKLQPNRDSSGSHLPSQLRDKLTAGVIANLNFAREAEPHAQLKILASLIACSPSQSTARRTAAKDSARGKMSCVTSR